MSVYLSWQIQGLNLEREAGLRDQDEVIMFVKYGLSNSEH